LENERKQAARQAEEFFLKTIQQILTEPHKENEFFVTKSEEKTHFLEKTKKGDILNHVNISHQVLDEGIDNTFIFSNSLFLEEEKKEGSWVLDFDGAHSSSGLGVGIVLRSPHN
jgi:hypothetical protein